MRKILYPNLNDYVITNADGPGKKLVDHSWESHDGQQAVYFRNLARHAIHFIERHDAVVGCVAWITHPDILDALAKSKAVSLIVQKEDFLRPDSSPVKGKAQSTFKRDLRVRYGRLPSTLDRIYSGLDFLGRMSFGGDTDLPAVRCVGNHNAAKLPAMPRCHHKFIVGCSYADDAREGVPDYYKTLTPKSVWTGSFNFTYNGTQSLENAVVFTDPEIAKRFFDEWQQVCAISEPLDWESAWTAPEWRIGT